MIRPRYQYRLDHRPSRAFNTFRAIIILVIAAMFIILALSIGLRMAGIITDECTLPDGQKVRGTASISKHGWSVWTDDGRLLNGYGFIQCETRRR